MRIIAHNNPLSYPPNPAAFNPLCTSELASMAAMREQFEQHNVLVLGVSMETVKNYKVRVRCNVFLRKTGPFIIAVPPPPPSPFLPPRFWILPLV